MKKSVTKIIAVLSTVVAVAALFDDLTGHITTIVINVRNVVSPPPPPPPPPPPTEEWTYRFFNDPKKLEAYMNLAEPDPKFVAIHCTRKGNIHVWYKGGKTGFRYTFRKIDSSQEEHPVFNYFFNDGTVVPIGWYTPAGLRFGYLTASKS